MKGFIGILLNIAIIALKIITDLAIIFMIAAIIFTFLIGWGIMKTKKIKQKARIFVRDKYPKSTNNYRKLHGKATRRGETNRYHVLGQIAKEIFSRYIKGE